MNIYDQETDNPFSVRLGSNEHRQLDTIMQHKKWTKGFAIKQAIEHYYEHLNKELEELKKTIK